jgi:hypothetical protein
VPRSRPIANSKTRVPTPPETSHFARLADVELGRITPAMLER